MKEYSSEIIQNYMVRKSKKQKTAFINRTKDVFEKQGYLVGIEIGGMAYNRNIVVGDVEQAQAIYTAHYDTCAVMPVPNFVTPKNIPVYVVYQLLLSAVILGAGCLLGYLVSLITNQGIGMLVASIAILLCCYQIMAGISNPNTYNDNTSGIVTLVEIAMSLPVEERSKVAFVFFDNEELGLLGSSMFAKKHHKYLENTLIVNFDCVSDGDYLLAIANKRTRKDDSMYESIQACLTSDNEKQFVHTTALSTFYPSDQVKFKKYLAIAAVHKAPILGYYLGRIHTPFDTKFDEKNISMLSAAMVLFTEKLLSE